MTAFTVTARFPTGEFNAHDRDGGPEWPPAPARLAAALLAAAHESGSGVGVVESLFFLAAPRISAPCAGVRRIGYGRWVPVNNEIKLDRRGRMTGIVDVNSRFASKGLKDPERGTLIGTGPDDVVRWVFGDAQDVDVEALRRVARLVTYLGRPTSPVILDVVEGAQEAPGAHSRWIPDENGRCVLRVATPELLRALDEREEQRRRSRVIGTHPPLDVRPTARYRRAGADNGAQVMALAPRDILVDAVLYRFPGGRSGGVTVSAADATTIVDQLRGQVPALEWVLPLFGEVGRRGVPVLRGFVLQAGSAPGAIDLAVRSGVVKVRPSELRELASLPRVVRAATAPSSVWTSVVPVEMEPEVTVERVQALADRLGVRLVWVGCHMQARASVGPDACEPGSAAHLTVVFDEVVAGPVVLDGVCLVPEEAGGLTVNEKRVMGE